jgi:hypothetical protein
VQVVQVVCRGGYGMMERACCGMAAGSARATDHSEASSVPNPASDWSSYQVAMTTTIRCIQNQVLHHYGAGTVLVGGREVGARKDHHWHDHETCWRHACRRPPTTPPGAYAPSTRHLGIVIYIGTSPCDRSRPVSSYQQWVMRHARYAQ